MVMIAGIAGGFAVNCALDMLQQPRIAVSIAPLDLMRCGRRTPQEPVREFHRVSMPASRTDTYSEGARARPRCDHALKHRWNLEDRAITLRRDPAAEGLHP